MALAEQSHLLSINPLRSSVGSHPTSETFPSTRLLGSTHRIPSGLILKATDWTGKVLMKGEHKGLTHALAARILSPPPLTENFHRLLKYTVKSPSIYLLSSLLKSHVMASIRHSQVRNVETWSLSSMWTPFFQVNLSKVHPLNILLGSSKKDWRNRLNLCLYFCSFHL